VSRDGWPGKSFISKAWVCEFIIRQLCIYGEADVMELSMSTIEQSKLNGLNYDLHQVNYCLKWLKMRGYIEETREESPSFTECLERAKRDKRIKNPERYCSQRHNVFIKVRCKEDVCRELDRWLWETYRARLPRL
jgi:hypothetical protein